MLWSYREPFFEHILSEEIRQHSQHRRALKMGWGGRGTMTFYMLWRHSVEVWLKSKTMSLPCCRRWHQTAHWFAQASEWPLLSRIKGGRRSEHQWQTHGGRHPTQWGLSVVTHSKHNSWKSNLEWEIVTMHGMCFAEVILTTPQSGSALSAPSYSINDAKPSFSQRSFHHFRVTRLPNHWTVKKKKKTLMQNVFALQASWWNWDWKITLKSNHVRQLMSNDGGNPFFVGVGWEFFIIEQCCLSVCNQTPVLHGPSIKVW